LRPSSCYEKLAQEEEEKLRKNDNFDQNTLNFSLIYAIAQTEHIAQNVP